jgi:hypothetical protein
MKRKYSQIISITFSILFHIIWYILKLGGIMMYNYMNYANSRLSNPINTNRVSFLQLNNYIRQLWMEHIFWTRLAIMSIASSSPDTSLVSARLLRNATDFGNLFSYFYGPQIGQQFGKLMHDHLTIAADLVVAAKNQDNNAVATIEKKWYKNADDIASFLSNINPYWNRNEIQQMMYEHLALTKNEAVAILTNKYAEGISLFDQIQKQALEMADVYIEGLVKQFRNDIIT